MLNLRRLRYFMVAAAEGNLHAAAMRLNIAQPALSRQIRELEQELAVDLFVRSSRGVKLTPAAQVLVVEAEKLFRQVEGAVRQTQRAARGEIGQLTIALTLASAELRFVVSALAAVRRQFVDVEFPLHIISSDQQIAAMTMGSVDVGVFYRRHLPPPGIQYRDLRIDRYNLMVSSSHPLAGAGSVHLAQVAEETFIFGTAPGWSHWPETQSEIMSAFLSANVMPKRIMEEISNLSTVINLVAEGVGVSIMNSSVQRSHPHADVAFIPIEGLETNLQLCVAWRESCATPALQRFVDCLCEKEALDGKLRD